MGVKSVAILLKHNRTPVVSRPAIYHLLHNLSPKNASRRRASRAGLAALPPVSIPTHPLDGLLTHCCAAPALALHEPRRGQSRAGCGAARRRVQYISECACATVSVCQRDNRLFTAPASCSAVQVSTEGDAPRERRELQ